MLQKPVFEAYDATRVGYPLPLSHHYYAPSLILAITASELERNP